MSFMMSEDLWFSDKKYPFISLPSWSKNEPKLLNQQDISVPASLRSYDNQKMRGKKTLSLLNNKSLTTFRC